MGLSMTVCEAPWTKDQVASINEFQARAYVHPFTGRNDLLPMGRDDILIATTEGFISQVDPDFKQDWCYECMVDWSWLQLKWPFPSV